MAKKKTLVESSEKLDSFVAEKEKNEEILPEIPKKEEKKQELGEKCDLCQNENVYVYCTRKPVRYYIRYYKCRNCGWQFKRVQKYSGT